MGSILSMISDAFTGFPSLSAFNEVDGLTPSERLDASGYQMESYHLNPGEILGTKAMLEIDNKNIDTVAAFFSEGYDQLYAAEGIESRYEIAESFYEVIKSNMGITASFSFAPFADPLTAGGYDDKTDSITLNVNYLEDENCCDLISTILHESRHALQFKISLEPNGGMVLDDISQSWAINFEHYILPEWDREAYRHQPIEEDAYDYEKTIMIRGLSAIGLA